MSMILYPSYLSTNFPLAINRNKKSYSYKNSYCAIKSPDEVIHFLQRDCTDADRIIFKGLWSLFENKNFEYVGMSQYKLASITGTSRRSVQRCLDKLYAQRILHREIPPKKRLDRNEVNKYRINEYLMRDNVVYRVRCFLKNISVVLFTLASLCSPVPHSRNLGAVLLIKERYLNKSAAGGCPLPRDARAREAARLDWDYITKKGDVVNADSLKLIKNNLDKLPLTTRGMLKLAVYPVTTIEHILAKRLNLNVDNLFSYIWSIARKETDPSFVVDFSFYEKSCHALGLNNDPYIDADQLQELKQQREATESSYKKQFKYKQTTGSLHKPIVHIDTNKPSYDKWGNKRPQTPQEFDAIRKETLEKFKQMQAEGDTNPFRAMFIKKWESETDASPANPLMSEGPTIGEVKSRLAVSDNSSPLREDFMLSFLAAGID